MRSSLRIAISVTVTLICLMALWYVMSLSSPALESIQAQSLNDMYLPLAMRNYPEPTRTPAPDIGLPSDTTLSTDLVVVGELKNYSQDYYTAGEITCKLYNSQDMALVQTTTYPFSYSLGPGDTTAFRCEFYAAPTEWSYYRVTFSPATAYSRPLSLVVSDITTTYDQYYRLEIRGFVTNQDTRSASSPIVWVAFYDASGKIVNAARGYSYLSLDPGESSAFSITVEGPIAGYTTYVVRAYDHYWTFSSTQSGTDEPFRGAWEEWRGSLESLE